MRIRGTVSKLQELFAYLSRVSGLEVVFANKRIFSFRDNVGK